MTTPRRWWRTVGWPIAVAVLGTAGMLAGGVPWWRALIIAVSTGGALWAVVATLAVDHPTWPYAPSRGLHSAPTAWEVPGLTGARQSAETFESYVRPRLWALAQDLLRRRNIDPASQRAVDLIGARIYAILTGAETDPRRVTGSVPALCQTIARLAVEPVDGRPPPVPHPALVGLAGARQRTGTRPPRRHPLPRRSTDHPTEGPRP